MAICQCFLLLQILSCKIGLGKSSKNAGLFALITLETAEDMSVCIEKLDKKDFGGKILETKKVLNFKNCAKNNIRVLVKSLYYLNAL